MRCADPLREHVCRCVPQPAFSSVALDGGLFLAGLVRRGVGLRLEHVLHGDIGISGVQLLIGSGHLGMGAIAGRGCKILSGCELCARTSLVRLLVGGPDVGVWLGQ